MGYTAGLRFPQLPVWSRAQWAALRKQGWTQGRPRGKIEETISIFPEVPMLKYRCLMLDHDDTVVQSAKTVNFPSFQEIVHVLRPQAQLSYRAFALGCFYKTFSGFCQDDLGYTPEDVDRHYAMWKAYVRTHAPAPFEGMAQLLGRFRQEGGLICVSSHSGDENIARDYRHSFGFLPHKIYSYDMPPQLRKPAPFALTDAMERWQLDPGDILMVDDMKPGLDMAAAAGVPFACAGWSHDFPEIAQYMQRSSPIYLRTVDQLAQLLFED